MRGSCSKHSVEFINYISHCRILKMRCEKQYDIVTVLTSVNPFGRIRRVNAIQNSCEFINLNWENSLFKFMFSSQRQNIRNLEIIRYSAIVRIKSDVDYDTNRVKIRILAKYTEITRTVAFVSCDVNLSRRQTRTVRFPLLTMFKWTVAIVQGFSFKYDEVLFFVNLISSLCVWWKNVWSVEDTWATNTSTNKQNKWLSLGQENEHHVCLYLGMTLPKVTTIH